MMLSEPVIGEYFFGRDEALGLLEKRVNALTEGYRQNVALTGQNLAGKSSSSLNPFGNGRHQTLFLDCRNEDDGGNAIQAHRILDIGRLDLFSQMASIEPQPQGTVVQNT